MSLKKPPAISPSANTKPSLTVTTGSTDLTDQGAVDYVFEHWCQFTDKDHPARLAFQQHRINNIVAWIKMTDDEMNTMTVNIRKIQGNRVGEILLTPVINARLKHVIIFGFDY